MAFDLDQATHNAMARVTYDIRRSAVLHEAQLAKRMVAMRAAWRSRQLVLEHELRGLLLPAAVADIYHHLQVQVAMSCRVQQLHHRTTHIPAPVLKD